VADQPATAQIAGWPINGVWSPAPERLHESVDALDIKRTLELPLPRCRPAHSHHQLVDCFDDAPMESFWGSIGLLNRKKWVPYGELADAIADYIVKSYIPTRHQLARLSDARQIRSASSVNLASDLRVQRNTPVPRAQSEDRPGERYDSPIHGDEVASSRPCFENVDHELLPMQTNRPGAWRNDHHPWPYPEGLRAAGHPRRRADRPRPRVHQGPACDADPRRELEGRLTDAATST
jgi:hypothetical protein